MQFIAILAALVAGVSAMPSAPVADCITVPIPSPTVEDYTATATATPTAELVAPELCVNMPAGLCAESVMVPGVAYETDDIFCKNNCGKQTIWCEIDEVTNKKDEVIGYVEKYWFCCGDDCKSIPEERVCEVDGENYTVGHAYDLGKHETMWCTSEDDVVYCKGRTCGETVELTPPGVDVCPVPEPTYTPAPTVAPGFGPAGPPTVTPGFGPAGPVMPMILSCEDCLALGNYYNIVDETCVVDCSVDECIPPTGTCPSAPVLPTCADDLACDWNTQLYNVADNLCVEIALCAQPELCVGSCDAGVPIDA